MRDQVRARLLWGWAVACLFFAALGGSGAGTKPSAAQSTSDLWSEPLLISQVSQSSWFPEVFVTRSGRVVALWSSGVSQQGGGYDQVMESSSLDGVTWSQPNDIVALPQGVLSQSEVTRPDIWLDDQDVVHMTFRGTLSQSVFYSHAPLAEFERAGSWSQPVEIGPDAYFSQVRVDRHGTIHVLYTANVMTRQCPICFHLYYRQSSDDGHTWTTALDISKVNSGSAKPQLLVDAEGGIHVVWESARGGALGRVETPTRILYSSSFDNGVTWREPVVIQDDESDGSMRVAMSIDPLGRLMVVSSAMPNGELYYALSSDLGQTWSLPAPINDLKTTFLSTLDNLSVAVDGRNAIHLICVCSPEMRQGTYDLAHVVWDGATWSDSDVIHRYTGDLPEWPVLAIGLGNQVHVVWFLRNEAAIFESDRGQYTIWYARKEVDAPAVTPVAEPTRVPISTLVVSTAQPTATMRPSATPIQFVYGEVNPTAVYSESDYVMLVAISLTPVLLIVAGIVIYQRVIRR